MFNDSTKSVSLLHQGACLHWRQSSTDRVAPGPGPRAWTTPSIHRKGTNGVSTNGVTANFIFFDRGTFWVLPLTCFYFPRSAMAYLFPQSVKNNYFCSDPISVDPICPQPNWGDTNQIPDKDVQSSKRTHHLQRSASWKPPYSWCCACEYVCRCCQFFGCHKWSVCIIHQYTSIYADINVAYKCIAQSVPSHQPTERPFLGIAIDIQWHTPEGGMIRLETLIELKFLNPSFPSLSSCWT